LGLIGLSRDQHAHSVLAYLRRQRTPNLTLITPGYEEKTSNKFVDNDVYWTLVGLIKDNYSQTTEQQIDAIKSYLNEDRTHAWYSKLYRCVRATVEVSIHQEMTEGRPKESLTYQLTPGVLLVGRPDIVEVDRVIEIKTRKEFAESICEKDKVQLYCYLKLANKQKGTLREVVGTETKDTEFEWDEKYWNKIVDTTLTMLTWL
jgi:hypothetical protein